MPDGKDDSGDIRIGGLFNGLNKFINLVSDMMESGNNNVQYGGEFKVPDKDKGIYGHYGINIRVGDNSSENIDRIREIANMKDKGTDQKPKIIEPHADLFQEEDGLVCIMELPGVACDDIKIAFSDDYIFVSAENQYKKFEKKIYPGFHIENSAVTHLFNNGILKITIKNNENNML